MRNEIVALAQQYVQQPAQAAVRRAVVPAAFGLVAAVFLVLGLMALLPLAAGRRQKPAPPPAPNPTPQFASLLAQTAPSLALKRPLLTALLLAVALGLTVRGASTDRK